MTRGLTKIFSPLQFLGIPQGRIATILSLSWIAIPVFWDIARKAICAAKLKEKKSLSNLISFLTNFIATLYSEAEENSTFWEGVSQKATKETTANFS